MGVSGLWTLLQPVGRPVQLENMEGKKIAIDSSIWLYQFQATMRDKDGRVLVNAHVVGFLRRICKLLFYGIKPVFVFDGGAPALKRMTITERKNKKAGAAQSYARTAEKILAAQMRREALNHAPEALSTKAAEALMSDAVYMEDLEGNNAPRPSRGSKTENPGSAPKPTPEKSQNRWADHDPYRLPDVDTFSSISKTATGVNPDPRLATEDELRSFIDEMVPEDFDIGSEAFRDLPTEVQYEIIGDLRLKSRQTSYHRLQHMLKNSSTPLDFSRAQIVNLTQRNNLTQQLLATTESVGKHKTKMTTTRIASERNRQYVLIKNEGAEGGWVLGVRGEAPGTRVKPIDIDRSGSSEVEEELGHPVPSEESDDDMEEIIPTINAPPDPDLRSHHRSMALAAIGNRSSAMDKGLASISTSTHRMSHNASTSAASSSRPTALAISGTGRSSFEAGGNEYVTHSFGPHSADHFTSLSSSDEDDPALAVALQKSIEMRNEESFQSALHESQSQSEDIHRNGDPERRFQFHKGHTGPPGDAASGSTYVTLMSRVSGHAAKFAEVRNKVIAGGKASPDSISAPRLPTSRRDPSTSPSPAVDLGKSRAVSSEMNRASAPSPSSNKRVVSGSAVGAPRSQSSASFVSPPSLLHTTDTPSTVPSPNTPAPVQSGGLISVAASEPAWFASFDPNAPPMNMLSIMPLAETLPLVSGPGPIFSTPGAHGQAFDFDTSVFQGESLTPPSSSTRSYAAHPRAIAASFEKPRSPTQAPKQIFTPSINNTNQPKDLTWNAFSQFANPKPKSTTQASSLPSPPTPARRVPSSATPKASPSTTSPASIRSVHPMIQSPVQRSSSFQPLFSTTSPLASSSKEAGPSSKPFPHLNTPDSPIQNEPFIEEQHDVREDFDAAQEIDVAAEEGDFVNLMSQVKGRDIEAMRSEIDEEIRLLNQQKKAAMRDSEDITQQMISQIQLMLRLFGIPYMTAPMEAEAQCAQLVSLGLVEGIITDDSDIFLFGGLRVFRNMFNQSKTVECYLLQDLARELGLDRSTLVNLAYLLGSDYTDGLPGVGPVLAMELLREFPGNDGLWKFREWWVKVQTGKDQAEDNQSVFRKRFKKRFKDLHISEDWPPAAVRDAYYHPTVDESEEAFKWGLPDLNGLRGFLNLELGWSSQKVNETLQPIIHKVGQRNQPSAANKQNTLESYFDASIGSGTYAPRKRQAYASKRLQKIVMDFRKERRAQAGMENEGSSSESESDDSDAAGENGIELESSSSAVSKGKGKGTRGIRGRGRGRGKANVGEARPRAKRNAPSESKGRARKKQKTNASSGDGSTGDEGAEPGGSNTVPDRPLAVTLRERRPRPKPVPKGKQKAVPSPHDSMETP